MVGKKRLISWSFTVAFLSVTIASLLPTQAQEREESAQPTSVTKSVPLLPPEGFQVSEFATSSQANDIQVMTIDSKNRVVVGGPGYIKILVDRDQDGRADDVIDFATTPDNVMGLCSIGQDLWCSSGAGVWHYRDADEDDRPDGPPELVFELKARGEHDLHAIRRGPDGKFYLIAGNMAGFDSSKVTSDSSIIKKPRAGVVIRCSDDFKKVEVLTHGLRNAYDFDFDALGRIYTYDSDGEREVSLPCYRPTRVFECRPGADAGWVTKTWKFPDYFPELPPVVGSFGRGSPTGVVVYRHHQFPAEYDNACFVLDWTFGRILVVHDGLGTSRKTTEFMRAQGSFGFAPTDIEVSRDGDLFVSVGGRGTRGSVYRIQYIGKGKRLDPQERLVQLGLDETEAIWLAAPQPQASWWANTPVSMVPNIEIDNDKVEAILGDADLPIETRLRLIEAISTHPNRLEKLMSSSQNAEWDQRVQAKIIEEACRKWSITDLMRSFDLHRERWTPDVKSRFWLAFGSRLRMEKISSFENEAALLRFLLNGSREPREVRRSREHAICSLAELLPIESRRAIAKANPELFVSRDGLAQDEFREAVQLILERLVEPDKHDFDGEQLDRIRKLQSLFEDQSESDREKFSDGYRGIEVDEVLRGKLEEIFTRIAPDAWKGEEAFELARLAAIWKCQSQGVKRFLLSRIATTKTSPIETIHYLNVLSQCRVELNSEEVSQIAGLLVRIRKELEANRGGIDNSWEPRMTELVQSLVTSLPSLSQQLVEDDALMEEQNSYILSGLSKENQKRVASRFLQQIGDRDLQNRFEIRLAATADSESGETKIREAFKNEELRGDALAQIIKRVSERDLEFVRWGLESGSRNQQRSAVSHRAKFQEPLSEREIVVLIEMIEMSVGVKELKSQLIESFELLARSLRDADSRPNWLGETDRKKALVAWRTWCVKNFESGYRSYQAQFEESFAQRERFRGIGDHGDAGRGKEVFVRVQCANCHSGSRAIGPSLEGISKRFSWDEIVEATVSPSQNVPDRYQATMIETVDGRTLVGFIVYESIDGVTLRDGNLETIRIESGEIASQSKASKSLMPEKLIDSLTEQELADLKAYLSQQ